MNRPVDVRGILERAGADADAPEGSQAWALAQVDAAVAELTEALRAIVASLAEHDDEGMIEHAEQMITARAALARVGGAK